MLALVAGACSPAAPSPAADAGPDVTPRDASDAAATDVTLADSAIADAPVGDGGTVHTTTVQFPLTTVSPGQEITLCVQVPLGNATPQLVRHGHVALASGSHHLIVYRMADGAETWTAPRPCGAFSGVSAGAPAMMMAQASASDLSMPDGVGLEIAANQVVRIEEHFINLGTEDIQGTGTVTLDTIDPVDGIVRANMFFWGPLGIRVPAHASGSADFFHRVTPGVHIFALSTHQHHFGTAAIVRQAPDATSPGTEVYRNTNWAEPPIHSFEPPLSFDGTTGVQLRCEWMNTSSRVVTFGESAATDEMCFIGGFYYPSHGFEVCLDSSCSSL